MDGFFKGWEVFMRKNFGKSYFGWALLFYFLLLVLFTSFTGVNFPFRDEWSALVFPHFKWLDGEITFIELLCYPVNEHFLPLSRVLLHLFQGERYNPKNFMFLFTALQAIALFVFYLGFLKVFPKAQKKPLFFFSGFFILASFSQKINFTMGLQVFWMLTYLGIILFIYGLNFKKKSLLFLGFVLVAGNMSVWAVLCFLFIVYALTLCFFRYQDFLLEKKSLFLTFIILTFLSVGLIYFKPLSSYTIENFSLSSFFDLLRFHLWFVASPFSRYQEPLVYLFGPLFYFLLVYFLFFKGLKNNFYTVSYLLITLSMSFILAFFRSAYSLEYAASGHYLIFILPSWCLLVSHFLYGEGLVFFKRGLAFGLVFFSFFISVREIYKEVFIRAPKLSTTKECLETKKEVEKCWPDPEGIIYASGSKNGQMISRWLASQNFPLKEE